MRYLLLSLLLLLSGVSFADALQNISEQLAQPALLQGQFQQKKRIKVLAAPLVSTGEFSVVRGEGVIWNLQKPMASQLIITASGIKGADIGDSRAMSHIGRILNQLLSGDLAVLEQQFTVAVTQQDEGGWALRLTPRSLILQKAISHIELNGQRHIQQLLLFEASGDNTEVTFSALTESDTVPEAILHVVNQH